jgi:hypothetical protein
MMDSNATQATPISYMFHPTIIVRDRAEFAQWLERAFRREGLFQKAYMVGMGYNDDYPFDYSYYMWVSDVWIDVIQLDRFHGEGKAPQFVSSTGHLAEFGWYTRAPDAAYQAVRRAGIRVYDQRMQEVTAAALPAGTSNVSPDVALTWLDARDTGLSVEIASMPEQAEILSSEKLFPRFAPDWRLPPLSADDPLQILRTSHHSVITKNLERSMRATLALGGQTFHKEENSARSIRSTFVYLADTVIEYIEPRAPDHPLLRLWDDRRYSLLGQAQEDIYHSITFQTADLARAADHFASEDIRITNLDDATFHTNPDDCLGVPWGFSSKAIEGDPRDA